MYVIGASWDKDELIRFWEQKVVSQGHIIVAIYTIGIKNKLDSW